MGGVPGGGHRRKGGSGQALLISGVAVFCLAIAVAAGPAVAKKITGTKRSELIVGTKGADRIKGKGGNDLLKGKGGNDLLNGGRGSDKVVGGKGNDKVVGGPKGDTVIGGPRIDRIKGQGGNDLLKAADGRRDSVIDGGAGTNKCIVDTVELDIVRNCGTVQASTPGQGPGGGWWRWWWWGTWSRPGTTGTHRRRDVRPLQPADGVGCNFHITGDGADEVTVASPVESGRWRHQRAGRCQLAQPPTWDALGGYTCTAAGSLKVTIGSESVDVPVPCAAVSTPRSLTRVAQAERRNGRRSARRRVRGRDSGRPPSEYIRTRRGMSRSCCRKGPTIGCTSCDQTASNSSLRSVMLGDAR